MTPPYLLLLLPLLIILLFLLPASQASLLDSLPYCVHKCGDIAIPYPFGFDPGCFHEGFRLVCNGSYNPPRLFTYGSGYEITELDPKGEMQILVPATRSCYNSSGGYISGTNTNIDLESSPYRLSSLNYFYAIGCPNQGYFVDRAGNYVSGCVSACPLTNYSFGTTASCTGVGCCGNPIPNGLTYYEPYAKWVQLQDFGSLRGTDPIIYPNSKTCSYVFLASTSFNYNGSYLSRTDDYKVQVAIEWAIRNAGNCRDASHNLTEFACRSANHDCYDHNIRDGYICNCAEGYEGNPYIEDGCQDINECELKDYYPCFGDCANTIGNYTCTCPRGYEGNAYTMDGCRKKDTFTLGLKIVTGASVGVFIVAFACFWLYLGMQKRRLIRTKQKFFEQNGGLLLQQQMGSFQTTSFKIYSKEELEMATNKFSEERILGHGDHGIVYKGIFNDGTIAAIKKSKIMEEHETKEFAKEMLILSQINHRNVVKLMGCCLEVEVPMLVYEYISNGTLYHYIHDRKLWVPIPPDERLRIAAESADALAYMHSSASPPILHGDVKSANILLDDNFVAKVSDFGASKLVANDEAEIATLVQGTIGYLDPDYFSTCRLIDKSDVYSFAVIILELLTRKKAVYFEGPEDNRNLASSFCAAKKDGRFLEFLDAQLRNELKLEVLEEIGDLVMRCLSKNREERPTMREVADTLQTLRRFQMQSCTDEKCIEDTESLLGNSINIHIGDSSMSDSFARQVMLDMMHEGDSFTSDF